MSDKWKIHVIDGYELNEGEANRVLKRKSEDDIQDESKYLFIYVWGSNNVLRTRVFYVNKNFGNMKEEDNEKAVKLNVNNAVDWDGIVKYEMLMVKEKY